MVIFATAIETAMAAEISTTLAISTVPVAAMVKAVNIVMVVDTTAKEVK